MIGEMQQKIEDMIDTAIDLKDTVIEVIKEDNKRDSSSSTGGVQKFDRSLHETLFQASEEKMLKERGETIVQMMKLLYEDQIDLLDSDTNQYFIDLYRAITV